MGLHHLPMLKIGPRNWNRWFRRFSRLVVSIGGRYKKRISRAITKVWSWPVSEPYSGDVVAPQQRDKNHHSDDKKVMFADVAGNEAAKEQLFDIVDFLQNPSRYHAYGAKLPRGLLLTGAPGVGKTLLAKAIAGEANVPFFSASGSDFQEIYVGVGAKRVRELFTKGKSNTPCIIFIDEFDALARTRDGTHEESARTLNALLTEMDGFSSSDSLVVIAATNFPELLDKAVTRPGRFDRLIEILPPDRLAREEILKLHARNKRADNVDFSVLSRKTAGMTGAHLATIMNEAAILAVKNRDDTITHSHIEEALARVIAGLKHTRVNPSIRNRVAVHEAGHAIVALALQISIEYVTIEPRGRALGYVFYSEGRDDMLMTQTELESETMILLAGRAAEFHFLKSYSTGAANDLKQAMELVHNMITRYGMGKQICVPPTMVDDQVSAYLDDYNQSVMEILMKNESAHKKLVERLVDEEHVDGDTISVDHTVRI